MMSTSKAVKLFVLFLGGALFFAPDAFALEMEYHTYNGFDPVLIAFQTIALVFGDNGYKTLFFAIIVLGILFGGISSLFKLVTGKGGGLAWVIPVTTGIVLYAGLILPRGTLHIYDDVLNRYQAVGNIPEGLVMLAGTSNLIERGMVEIIYTAGDPASYQNAAGGIGFDALLKASAGNHDIKDAYMNDSLGKYVRDCLFYELMRPGTNLSVNDIVKNSTDFITQYDQAVNPAVYTVYYDESNKTGVTMTCTDAWARIKPYLQNPDNLEKAQKAACAYAGFNPDNPNEYQRCKEITEKAVAYTSGGAISIPSVQYIRQAYMAQNLNSTLLSVNPDMALTSLANRNAVVSNMGTGLVANEWLPIARAIVTGVTIGLVPIIVLFIPTPHIFKAIGLIFGFFVWLTAWGVTDAITHSFAINNAYKTFEEVRQNNIGYLALMTTPDTAIKTLSMFGMARTFGIMLATIISGILGGFGGHALAMMAGNISGQIQAQGTSAAMATQTPEGRANTMRQTWDVMPTEAMANHYSVRDIWQSKTNQMAKQHGSGMGLGDTNTAFETGKWGSSVETEMAKQQRELYGTSENTANWKMAGEKAEVGGYGTPQSKAVSGIQAIKAKLGEQATERFLAEKFGFGDNVEAYKEWKAKGMVLNEDQATHLKKQGFWGVEAGMKIEERSLGFKDNGDIANLKAQKTDGSISQSYENGLLTERGSLGNNIQFERVMGKDGVLSGSAQGEFNFNGRVLKGRLVNAGGAYNFEGIDQGSNQTVRMQGSSASDVDLATGNIKNWQAYHETGDRGTYDKFIMSKSEAMERFEALKGSEFYKGIQNMNDGQAVSINVARDSATGQIATINAEQGGISKTFDHRSSLTGSKDTHEALKVVDTGLRKNTGVVDVNHDERYKTVKRGVEYSTGNDTLSMFIDNDPRVLVQGYSEYFRGQTPQAGGRALVDHVAGEMGGYGKISQGTQDSLKASLKAGVDIGDTFWGKTLGIKAGLSTEAQRQAVESIDANVVATGMQNQYGNIMRQDKSSEWKMQQFTKFTNDVYSLVNKQSTMSTGDQMVQGADNPAKGQGLSQPPSPVHYTGNPRR